MKKNLFIKLNLLWVIISFPQISFSQNIRETIKLADNCFANHDYDDALYYYQRVLFFGNKKQKELSYENTAKCYFETKNFEKAYEYYGFAYSSCVNDSLKKEILFKKVMTLLHEKSYKNALVDLFDLQVPKESFYFSHKKEMYFTITYFLLEDFEKSEKHAYKYFSFNNLKYYSQVKDLYKLNLRISRKSPKMAAVMSSFLPGLGQLYIGDYRNATNSLLLTGSLLTLGIYVGYNYGVLNSIVSVFPWFYRYYAGGKRKVKIEAKNRINIQRQDILQNLLLLMQKK